MPIGIICLADDLMVDRIGIERHDVLITDRIRPYWNAVNWEMSRVKHFSMIAVNVFVVLDSVKQKT